MNIRPIRGKIVIKMLESDETTKNGIILPNKTKEKSQIAEIVTISEHEVLKIGDKVLASKYAGTEVKYDGQDYRIILEKDVLAIID